MKTKILIVDDYQENIHALTQLIQSPDVEIHAAEHADSALELLTRHEFGLALLDVQMPNVSGFELAKIIRGVKRFRSLPIIFVTAHREDSSVIFEGYKTGAVDLLFKPLEANMVRAKVQMFVELAKQKSLLQMHVQELERLRIAAEAANIAKSQFLANMSHEIRTPLAAVMGFAEMLSAENTPEEEKSESIAAIRRNGTLLLRLVDDILDLSKIEANKMEFERVAFDLRDLLNDIEATLAFRAQDKGIRLELQVPTKDLHYVGDSMRIKQVLLNIIGNAIKFTSQGAVEVRLEVKSLNDKDHLFVRVKDQGVGLTADQAERLFQPFGQADASTKRQFGGSGLGLVISRQIACAMGGDIRLLNTKPGEGSLFEIELMLDKDTGSAPAGKNLQAGPPAGYLQNLSLSGKRILAIDDSPDNLMLIAMFLRSSGAEIIYAENGFEALEKVQNQEFDMVLMDVQMPGMDGHETTRKMREGGYEGPIVALTAHAVRSEHDKCLESGCNEVLTKPINKESLLKGIHANLRWPQAAEQELTSRPT